MLSVADLRNKLIEDGYQVTEGDAAKTTESFYFTVQKEDAYCFVRISNHPKPGFLRMISHNNFAYIDWYVSVDKAAEKIEKYVVKP